METTMRVPLRERVNLRMVLFFGGILAIIGWVLWKMLLVQLTGGIINRGEFIEVDLKSMSDFEMHQQKGTDQDIPPRFRDLNGKRVLLVGEMWTSRAAAGQQSDFDLVYSIQRCCFTGTPKIQHFIKCTVMPGKLVEALPGLVNVYGTLHVGIERSGEQILSVFRVDVEKVEQAG